MTAFCVALRRVLLFLARLSPQRHYELVLGMIAELDSIDGPAEQARFACGAVAAMGTLAFRAAVQRFRESLRFLFAMPRGDGGAHLGGPVMSQIMTRQLLRRHSRPFAITLASLTLVLMANQVIQWGPRLSARGASVGMLAEVLLLSLPFTLALTVPMAVFLSVCWVFARLGKEGLLASTHHGFRRLVLPVVAATAVVASLTLVLNSEVLPRANSRLTAVLSGGEGRLTEREMTMGELWSAAQSARTATDKQGITRASAYEVEIQKRLALPAACIVFALVGAAMMFRFPRGGIGLVIGGSSVVFGGYYGALVAGESLADRQIVSAGIAMWTANALLLGIALALAWTPERRGSDSGIDPLANGEPGAA